jgi:hypothetical protein
MKKINKWIVISFLFLFFLLVFLFFFLKLNWGLDFQRKWKWKKKIKQDEFLVLCSLTREIMNVLVLFVCNVFLRKKVQPIETKRNRPNQSIAIHLTDDWEK